MFNLGDILNKDDKPIACFRDLKPGEDVLARWSDNKFHNATVDFIGTADKTVDNKKATKKDMKKKRCSCWKILQPSIPTPSRPDHLCTGSPKYSGPKCHSASNNLASVPASTYSHFYLSSHSNSLATVLTSSFPVITTTLPAFTSPVTHQLPVWNYLVSNSTQSQPFAVFKASPASHSTALTFRPNTTAACFGRFASAKTATSSYSQRKLPQNVAQSWYTS